MSDLRNQIESLSAAEKLELLDTVWESLETGAASLTEVQREELDRRIARHEQNPSDVIPWEHVRASRLEVGHPASRVRSPRSGENVSIDCEPPADFQSVLQALKASSRTRR